MKNIEVLYQVKRPDGLYSEVKKFRLAAITNSDQHDEMEFKEYFTGLIAESEKVERESIRAKGYKEFR
ncbi:hypothetical protein [Planococcus halotolerans]|uniref:Uncharacterized protein n=1 Tax=Planococcus halotolerans TaxID=2233542 RepID=A0A365KKN6_9BACL|nr:hypothetical protein [Planococcus halotolerans]RAZ73614.1 hypothetical protein DP120_16900 [Planococcus halotolerans]